MIGVGMDIAWTPDQRRRVGRATPFVIIGSGFVVLGGLVAAITAPASLAHGSWAAAYLVLVTGVAQIGLGVGQALLGQRIPTAKLVLAELVGWTAGSAAVIAGTLVTKPWLVSAGGAVLVVTLGLLAYGARGSGSQVGRLLWLYRGLLLVLLVSIPVGLVLSAIRS